MITMNLPMVCLVNLINYRLNSMHQAQIDLDRLVQDAHRTGYAHGDIQFYSHMFKRKLFTHYYSRVKQLA